MIRPMTKRILILAAIVVAGCGSDDRLTKSEYSAALQPKVDRVTAAIGAVFQATGKAEEGETVPARARKALSSAAKIEAAAATEIDELAEPEEAEPPAAELVTAARRQASEIEALAADESLTVAEMADALEGGGVLAALEKLQRGGFVRLAPPG